MAPGPGRLWLPVLALAAAGALAQPPQVYRWTDRDGTPHYTDRLPPGAEAASAVAIRFQDGPSAMARLRIEDSAGGHLAWVDNLLAGPIEVLLHAYPGDDPASDPPLPARASVPALQSTLVAVIAPGRHRLWLQAVPGSTNARPQPDVQYAYPLQTGVLRTQQAWDGGFSHGDDGNRHAVDFAAATGTVVLAARDGTVMQVETGFDDAEPGDADAVDRANFIRILHNDGSMALYAHLQADGALVRVGEHVRRGQPIGLSGNTGFSTGPHLHFVVQVNRGLRLHSIPFRMFGPHGVLHFNTTQAGDSR